MTVYVDSMSAQYGRMKMCHMIADTDDELHAMAERIGVARKWHQAPPKSSASHYDIAMSKRALAVAAGATEITMKECVMLCARKRETGIMGAPGDVAEWFSNRKSPFRDKLREILTQPKATP